MCWSDTRKHLPESGYKFVQVGNPDEIIAFPTQLSVGSRDLHIMSVALNLVPNRHICVSIIQVVEESKSG